MNNEQKCTNCSQPRKSHVMWQGRDFQGPSCPNDSGEYWSTEPRVKDEGPSSGEQALSELTGVPVDDPRIKAVAPALSSKTYLMTVRREAEPIHHRQTDCTSHYYYTGCGRRISRRGRDAGPIITGMIQVQAAIIDREQTFCVVCFPHLLDGDAFGQPRPHFPARCCPAIFTTPLRREEHEAIHIVLQSRGQG